MGGEDSASTIRPQSINWPSRRYWGGNGMHVGSLGSHRGIGSPPPPMRVVIRVVVDKTPDNRSVTASTLRNRFTANSFLRNLRRDNVLNQTVAMGKNLSRSGIGTLRIWNADEK